MVEEMLASRGIEVSYGTVRRRASKFGQAIARRIRGARRCRGDKWHLDEMVVKINGRIDSNVQERDYLASYNTRVGLHRLFHTLNSLSWAGFVGGCGCMIGIAAGAALSHGAVIAAVVLTALSVVIWDKLWGERCAPRNALTPHIDRNHLHKLSERADLWALLDKEGKAKSRLQRAMLAALPANPTGPNLARRYKYIWRHVPIVGGVKRLAGWVAKANNDTSNWVLLNYLVDHMANEKRATP